MRRFVLAPKIKADKLVKKHIDTILRHFLFLNIKLSGPMTKIVSEYDQEIPQSQTADNPVAPQGRAAQPSRDTRKTN